LIPAEEGFHAKRKGYRVVMVSHRAKEETEVERSRRSLVVFTQRDVEWMSGREVV
jgi:hypothetical protein